MLQSGTKTTAKFSKTWEGRGGCAKTLSKQRDRLKLQVWKNNNTSLNVKIPRFLIQWERIVPLCTWNRACHHPDLSRSLGWSVSHADRGCCENSGKVPSWHSEWYLVPVSHHRTSNWDWRPWKILQPMHAKINKTRQLKPREGNLKLTKKQKELWTRHKTS